MLSAHASQLLEGKQGTVLGAGIQQGSLQEPAFGEPTVRGVSSFISHHELLREVL